MRKSLILIILISFWGCGNTFDDLESNSAAQSFTEKVEKGGVGLDDRSLGIALRICYALRSKRLHYETDLLGQRINFQVSSSSCENNTSIPPTQRSLGLYISKSPTGSLFMQGPQATTFFTEIITDKQGPLSSLCETALSGGTPLDLEGQGLEFKRFSFRDRGLDQVEIEYARVKDPNAFRNDREYEIYQTERFSFLTDNLSSGPYIGLTSESLREINCSNASVSQLIQTFQDN